MKPAYKNLGKVRPTVDNSNWSIDNKYDLLTIVYDPSSNKSYISRKDVPANIIIDNREYWLPFGVGRFVDNAIININYLDGVSQELVTYTLEEAIARIDDEDKRLGVIISFYGNEASDFHTPGWCLYQFMSDDLNDWDNVNAWNSIYYNRNKNVGWFRTESELLAIYPYPHKGDYCYIGTSLISSFVYRCYENGTWINTQEFASVNIGITIGGNISISENGTWVVDNEDTGIKAVGTGIEKMTYTPSQEDGGINILQVKLTDGIQFSFPIKNGNQGNSGIIVPDLETFLAELVNNLTTDDGTKALSAAQGVVLDNKISQLGQQVDTIIEKHEYTKGKRFASGSIVDCDSWGVSIYLHASVGDTIEINYGGVDGNINSAVYYYDSSFENIGGNSYSSSSNIYTNTLALTGIAYIRAAFNMNYIDSVYIKINNNIVWKPLLATNNVFIGIYTEKKGSLIYPLSRKSLLNCIIELNVYSTDNSICVDDYYLVILGYLNNRFYLGIRSKTDNTQYYGTTYNNITSQPSSGINTYGIIFTNTKFIYANITIDWSKYDSFINDETGTGVYKDVSVKIQPFSLCKKLIGEGIRLLQDYSFSNVNIIGDKTTIYVDSDTAKIRLIDNAAIKDINFIYVADDAISSREIWVDGHGNLRLVPLIGDTELENDNIGLNGVDTSFVVIPTTSNQCSVENCRFEAFPRITIWAAANGRHENGNHAIIENNTFIRCYKAIYLLEEFARVSQNTFQGCVICIICGTSDMAITNCKFLQSDVCLYFRKNNDSYGYVNSCSAVHCGKAFIWAHLIPTIGFQVNNCQIMQAPIICKEANALSVANCWLNTYFIIDAGVKSRIVSNMMAKNYASNDGVTDIYDVPSDTQIQLNRAIRITDTDADYNRS